MKRATTIAIGLGTALTLGLAAAAFAQPYGYGWGMGGGMGMGPGMGMGGGMGPGMGGGGMMRGYGPGFGGGYSSEERLAVQKLALKITPAQESAWDQYASAIKKQSEAMQAQHEAMYKAAPANAVERRDLHLKLMKERLAQAETMNGAFKNLYAVLTPEQRASLDQRGYGYGSRGGRGR